MRNKLGKPERRKPMREARPGGTPGAGPDREV
jgi:hypothetical protein